MAKIILQLPLFDIYYCIPDYYNVLPAKIGAKSVNLFEHFCNGASAKRAEARDIANPVQTTERRAYDTLNGCISPKFQHRNHFLFSSSLCSA